YGLQRDSLLAWTMSGVALGLAALTRSVVWLFPPVLAIFILAVGGPISFQRRVAAGILFFGGFAVTLAPRRVLNSLLQKTFVGVDVMGGRNVMMGNYEFTPLYRAWDAISKEGEEAWYRVLEPKRIAADANTQGKIDKVAMQYALQYMSAHPAQTI